MRTIGLDVHKRFAEVAILNEGERLVRRGDRVDATPAALRAFAATLGPNDQVVLEATVNTWAIADLLRTRAGRVVISNPMRTRAIADAKIKTDRVDAAVLAQLLAADFIPEVWMPDEATRERRRRTAHRSALVQLRTRERNRIHAILHRNLVESPYSDLFGRGGRRWLSMVALPAGERGQVTSTLRMLTALEAEIAVVEAEIASEALLDARVKLLMTIPGVGVTTRQRWLRSSATSHAFLGRTSWSDILVSILACGSRAIVRPAPGTSVGRATPTPEVCSSKQPTRRFALQVRYAPFMNEHGRAEGVRSPRWPWPASSPCSPGICCTVTRSTAGPHPP